MPSIYMESKRGISPVIATVLLIAMVIVIGLIIFLWFSTFIEEEGTKFGENIKFACEEVSFDASYLSGELTIKNVGNVPIFEMKIKLSSAGSHETKDLKDLSGNWPELGLNQGKSFKGAVSIGSADKITLIPVLAGSSKKGKTTFVCEEQYGQEITI